MSADGLGDALTGRSSGSGADVATSRPPSAAETAYETEVDAAVFVISVAAQLAGMHPQTLRQYDRLGLVSPDRSAGRGRRYSLRDIAVLREVQRLSHEEGVNLAGIKRILELEGQVDALRRQLERLADDFEPTASAARYGASDEHPFERRYLPVPVPPSPSGALVIWRSSR